MDHLLDALDAAPRADLTGENIYDALDWGNPSGAGKLSALILFVGLPFLWILLYCIFLGRRCHRVATSESGKLPV